MCNLDELFNNAELISWLFWFLMGNTAEKYKTEESENYEREISPYANYLPDGRDPHFFLSYLKVIFERCRFYVVE